MKKNFLTSPIFLLLPALFTVFLVTIWPTIYTFYLSLFDQNGFIGLKYYMDMTTDPLFWRSLQNSLIFISISVTTEFLLGFSIAMFVYKALTNKMKAIMKSIFIFPIAATPIALATGWRIMYHPVFGIINYFLGLLHLPAQAWLGSSLAMPSIIIIDIWQWTFFISLVLLAGLEKLPKEPFEAAQIDGATEREIIRYLTLPLLKNLMITVLLIRIIDAFKTFEIIYATTEGGPGFTTLTLNIYAFLTAFRYYHLNYAAAISIFLLFILTLLVFVLIKQMKVE